MSNPATPALPTPLPADILAKITAAAKALPAAFQAIAVAYAPAVLRIITDNANADLAALYNRLTGVSAPAALDQLHALMTREELEAEKAALDPLMAEMAQQSYAAKQLFNLIMEAALSAGISLAFKAAGF